MCPADAATRTPRPTIMGIPPTGGPPNSGEVGKCRSGAAAARPPRDPRAAHGHTAGSTAVAIPGEAAARVRGNSMGPVGDGSAARPGAPSPALVAALDQALLAAQELAQALGAAARQQAELAAQLARARALAGVYITPNQVCAAVLPLVRPLGALSPREAEVLRLLAAGHSNRAIARALFLSPRTVQRHVANIYPKIGAHCRAEATAYALDHGLR